MREELIAAIVEEVLLQLRQGAPFSDRPVEAPAPETEDITSAECRAVPLLKVPQDPEALARMKKRTTARIGVGRAGPRLKTKTLLTLRADHAQARDAVFADVDPGVLETAGLFTVQSM